ncbi:hypothetical protein [Sporocytophaga myxococcoides]|uniref:hypothetical protein n=1 Tax=Sporocytophaga myxococcoides TaxID=153721 RepID=UPI0004058F12|nr:hypothetical protein [Sporocytophaga myxococcoides]
MKILFICGSLEPGCDGVGDYTRRLAGELIRKGNEVRIIALNDKNARSISCQVQEDDNTSIVCLRLPHNISWNKRMKEATLFMDNFNPAWLSLQYVPFAFQDKGLPLGLVSKLKSLSKGRKWHIMFHELWVGMDKESSLKMKLWGSVQRLLILHLLNELNPSQIHTQLQVYKAVLNNLGYNASLLPLFSNIPHRDNLKRTIDSTYYTCILFGGIHSGAPVKVFINELKEYCSEKKRLLKFVFIGRSGETSKEWTSVLEDFDIPYRVTGECDPKEISEYLHEADLGISTTPYFLVEKSGTVAAMLSHSLPVLCVARSWSPKLSMDEIRVDSVVCYKVDSLKKSFPINTTLNRSFFELRDISELFIKELK